ncbi:MAG TPA: aromatic amino acid ammonia-lyase [Steroidobacteraceae bacterium]|nr:aromatic amino acid ammonia-lyase [Steroidobacteraceae bacterium]
MNLRAPLAPAVLLLALAGTAPAASAYQPITPTLASETVVLNGRDLSIDEVVKVARQGAPVDLSPEARQRSADAYGLLLEAAAEGVSVYWFNRGAGSGREHFIFKGDPLSPENKKLLEARQLANFESGAREGLGPEVGEEEIVRAMMVVRANTMSYDAASPALTQMLLDLLNHRITPVVRARGTLGESDLGLFMNIAATMVGAGDAYYRGERMPAAEALRRAGLVPLKPFGADDSALESSNAYATGQAALMVHDARQALLWADLTYVIDLNGMNSSISPLSLPVQANRPIPWLNWDAARVLDMLRGSYLFERDEARIIQDPESLRASSIRQGAAWQSWAQLRADVLLQLNSSDHNPAVRVGLSPSDAWELATPQLSQFFVKGGPRSHGQHGFIVSNANWDPYPMANEIEAFSIALANLDVVITQRQVRFSNSFFTVISPPVEPGGFALVQGRDYHAAALMQEVQGLINPVPPEGNAIIKTVEDLQTQTRLKVVRAREIVSDTIDLLAEDLLTGTYWLDLRKTQNPQRRFGPAADAVLAQFRQVLPLDAHSAQPTVPIHELAASFIREHPAESFHHDTRADPESTARGPPGR